MDTNCSIRRIRSSCGGRFVRKGRGSGQVFLDDRRPYGPNEAKASASAPGDGTWKQLTASVTMAQADSLWVHLYGDMYTPTSGGQTDSASVLYDDLQVSSVGQGSVISETFEAGVTVGSDSDSTTSWTSSGEVVQSAVWDPAPTAWKRDVLYLGDQAIAEIDDTGVHELHADHLGTPKLITKGYGGADKGTIEGRQEFGAYGEKLIASGYVPLTGYTGHVQTDPTGLTYMRARYFSAAWHRFLNSDQGVDPMSWNQFAYGGGSPLQFTDPTGLRRQLCGFQKQEYEVAGAHGFWWEPVYCEVPDNKVVPSHGGSGGGGTPPAPQTPTKPNPCSDPIVGSKKAIDDARALFKLQGSGFNKTERSMWALFDSGGNDSGNVPWPWSAATASETWRGPLPFGPGGGANVHVHPNRPYDPAPSTTGMRNDLNSTNGMVDSYGFNVPFYTVSRYGIWRLDNITGQSTQLADGKWLKEYPCP